MEDKYIVGIADMKMALGTGMLVTYALGSCIGICLWDPVPKLGAMVHVMLPLNLETGRTNPMKYADTGIRETLRLMEEKGALRRRITAKIAGGARMFSVPGSTGGGVGERNLQAVRLCLQRQGIPIAAEDVGGEWARTLLFDVSSGMGCVRSCGRQDRLL